MRTDLALEERESFDGSGVEIHGVEVEESCDEERDVRLTRVKIVSERGAREMGKSRGTYLTLEAPGLASPDEDYHREVSEVIADLLRELTGTAESVLVAGLGNRDVTPDALGPQAVSNLMITRHLIREYGREMMGMDALLRSERNRSRRYGTDRNGDIGDPAGHYRRDQAGSADCN